MIRLRIHDLPAMFAELGMWEKLGCFLFWAASITCVIRAAFYSSQTKYAVQIFKVDSGTYLQLLISAPRADIWPRPDVAPVGGRDGETPKPSGRLQQRSRTNPPLQKSEVLSITISPSFGSGTSCIPIGSRLCWVSMVGKQVHSYDDR